MFDYHTHTIYSADVPDDSGFTVDVMCDTAIKKGISEIAITDHCDIDGITMRDFLSPDFVKVYSDIRDARNKYGHKIKILFGIEFGQPIYLPEVSWDLVQSYPFDIVIGSVHSVRGIYDLFNLDFSKLTYSEIERYWQMYIEEMHEMIEWGDFDVLAHITYPLRYLLRDGVTDFPPDRDMLLRDFEPIFKKIIERDICLECNTSGLRKKNGDPFPADLMSLYYSMGGRRVTIGSDAHSPKDIGADFDRVINELRAIGFDSITRIEQRKKIQHSL